MLVQSKHFLLFIVLLVLLFISWYCSLFARTKRGWSSVDIITERVFPFHSFFSTETNILWKYEWGNEFVFMYIQYTISKRQCKFSNWKDKTRDNPDATSRIICIFHLRNTFCHRTNERMENGNDRYEGALTKNVFIKRH